MSPATDKHGRGQLQLCLGTLGSPPPAASLGGQRWDGRSSNLQQPGRDSFVNLSTPHPTFNFNHPFPTLPSRTAHPLLLLQHIAYLTPAYAMPGFDFSNHNRNAALHAQGVPLPKATSTGTTIVGCLYDGGVVIAADTRATSGPIVADKVSPSPLLRPSASGQIYRVSECLEAVY